MFISLNFISKFENYLNIFNLYIFLIQIERVLKNKLLINIFFKYQVQLIESRGFRAENHYIQTLDGYILTVTRIINPYVKDRDQLRPVLLQHGFQSSANLWLINSMGKLNEHGQYIEDNNVGSVGNTLGFVLAVNGFDVWLANMRGNRYSLNHTKFKIEGLF